MGFLSDYFNKKKEQVKQWREECKLAKIPRIDKDLPLNLRLGNIFSLKAGFADQINDNGMLDYGSLEALFSGLELKNFGFARISTDTIYRFYLTSPEGQEYILFLITDRRGKLYENEIYLFMQLHHYVPDCQENYDLYMSEGQGVIGDPVTGIKININDPDDQAILFHTVWGNEDEWTPPKELKELIYDDPREEAGMKVYHHMNLFWRPLDESGNEKEYAILDGAHFYNDPNTPDHDFDEVAMLTYIGLNISMDQFSVSEPVKQERSEDLEKIISLGKEWGEKFSGVLRRIPKDKKEIVSSMKNIVNGIEKVFKNFEDDPRDMDTSRANIFLNQRLPRIHKMLDNYATLALSSNLTEEEKARLAEIETQLPAIKEFFDELLVQFRENNLTDLRVDSKTLDALIGMDVPTRLDKDIREK